MAVIHYPYESVPLAELLEAIDIDAILAYVENEEEDYEEGDLLQVRLPNGTYFEEDPQPSRRHPKQLPGPTPAWPAVFRYVFGKRVYMTEGVAKYKATFNFVMSVLSSLEIGSVEEGYKIADILGYYVVRTSETTYEIAKSAYIAAYITDSAPEMIWRKIEGITNARTAILYKLHHEGRKRKLVVPPTPAASLSALLDGTDVKPVRLQHTITKRFVKMIEDGMAELNQKENQVERE